ncbi:hypothetical protein D3C76_457370 [compost metagenome]
MLNIDDTLNDQFGFRLKQLELAIKALPRSPRAFYVRQAIAFFFQVLIVIEDLAQADTQLCILPVFIPFDDRGDSIRQSAVVLRPNVEGQVD